MLHLLQFLFDYSEFLTGETRHIVPPCNKSGISNLRLEFQISFKCGAKNCQPVQNPLILYCPHPYPPPILSNPMLALPLFYPIPCMPSPYSIPLHACPFPILFQPMHTLLLVYPSQCTPSPYSIPPHACYPAILTQPMHTLHILCSTPCMHSLQSNSILFCSIQSHPMHALSLFPPSPHKPPQYSILFQPMLS